VRKIIDSPVYMTYGEMKETFIGKWILITNCKYAEYGKFIGGIPVAIADTVFEGQEDGFYDKFKDPMYSPRTDKDFDYDNVPGIMGFFNTLETAGGKIDAYN